MRRLWICLVVFAVVLAGCSGQEPAPSRSSAASQAPSEAAESSTPEREAEAPVNYIRGVADDVIAGLALDGATDDAKILAVYRYLIETTYFTDPVGRDMWRYRSEQTVLPTFEENLAISPLVFGVGSCEDYACALVVLLEQLGFEAQYLPGFTISVTGDYVDHAWTLVEMEGQWYHLDCQLEQNILRNGVTNYRYFLKTDDEMITDHKWGRNLIEYWPNLSPEEATNIRENHTPPACVTPFPQKGPEPLVKAARPDVEALRLSLLREREEHGLLEEIPMNIDPPVLIASATGKGYAAGYQGTGTGMQGMAAPGEAAEPVGQYARSFLPEEGKALYDDIVRAATAYRLEEPLPLDAALRRGDGVGGVLKAVSYDQPQLYWLGGRVESGVLTLHVGGGLTLADVRARQAEIDAAADTLLAQAAGDSAARAAAVHDGLAATIAFDRSGAQPDIGNLYGGLVRREAVCDGYSRSYQYLLTRMGIHNVFVSGRSMRGVPHSWNGVELGGGWYYTDVTWDVAKGRDTAPYHDYVAVSFEEMAWERSFPADQYPRLPATTGSGENYYEKNGYAVEPARGQLAGQLAEVFVRQLEDKAVIEGGYQYLDAKLLCSSEDYDAYKEQYIKGMFSVLYAMEALVRQRNLPLRIETEGVTSCDFNDTMQILVLYPKVYPA